MLTQENLPEKAIKLQNLFRDLEIEKIREEAKLQLDKDYTREEIEVNKQKLLFKLEMGDKYYLIDEIRNELYNLNAEAEEMDKYPSKLEKDLEKLNLEELKKEFQQEAAEKFYDGNSPEQAKTLKNILESFFSRQRE